jgi:hypothetical protein
MQSSGLQRRVVRRHTAVSEEHIASIFKVESKPEKKSVEAGFTLLPASAGSCLAYHEYGDIFSLNYNVLYIRK